MILREEKTVNQIAAEYELNPVMISRWKGEFFERASMVFEKGASEVDKIKKEAEEKQSQMEKKIGQLTIEVDWLKKNWPQVIHIKGMLELRHPQFLIHYQLKLILYQ